MFIHFSTSVTNMYSVPKSVQHVFKSINTTIHEAKCIGHFTVLYGNSCKLLSNNKLAEKFKCVSLLTYWTHRKNIIHNSMNIKNTAVQMKVREHICQD